MINDSSICILHQMLACVTRNHNSYILTDNTNRESATVIYITTVFCALTSTRRLADDIIRCKTNDLMTLVAHLLSLLYLWTPSVRESLINSWRDIFHNFSTFHGL